MKFLIIDGNAFLYRAYYATQHLLKKQLDQQTTNGVFISLKMLKRLLIDQNFDQVVVTFDLGKNTFRHQEYKNYKAQRQKTPETLIEQIPLFKTFLKALKITVIEDQNHEADDLIASLINLIEKKIKQPKISVLSGDQDLLQLVNSNVEIMFFQTGISKLKLINQANFEKLIQLQPQQIPDYKSLVGDKSDNLPGITGIGPKTAKKLLQKYNNLKNIFANQTQLPNKLQIKFANQAIINQANFIKKIATLKNDVEIKINFSKSNVDFDNGIIQKLFVDYNMKSLINKNKLHNQRQKKFFL